MHGEHFSWRCSANGQPGCACSWWDPVPGNQQILIKASRPPGGPGTEQYARDCHDLGITVHGTFILTLPGPPDDGEPLGPGRWLPPSSCRSRLPGAGLYQQAMEAALPTTKPAWLRPCGRHRAGRAVLPSRAVRDPDWARRLPEHSSRARCRCPRDDPPARSGRRRLREGGSSSATCAAGVRPPPRDRLNTEEVLMSSCSSPSALIYSECPCGWNRSAWSGWPARCSPMAPFQLSSRSAGTGQETALSAPWPSFSEALAAASTT